MAEIVNDSACLSHVFMCLAMAKSKVGDIVSAKDYAVKALLEARAGKAIDDELAALNTLAIYAAHDGNWDEAEQLYTDGLTASRRAGSIENESRYMINLGSLAYRRGEYDKARRLAREALDINRKRGSRHMMAIIQGNLAQAELKMGQTEAARRIALDTLALSIEIGAAPFTLFALQIIGEIAASEGNLDEALALLGLARAHPAAAHSDIEEIDAIVAEFDLPADRVAAGLAAGALLDLDAVIAEMLDSKP